MYRNSLELASFLLFEQTYGSLLLFLLDRLLLLQTHGLCWCCLVHELLHFKTQHFMLFSPNAMKVSHNFKCFYEFVDPHHHSKAWNNKLTPWCETSSFNISTFSKNEKVTSVMCLNLQRKSLVIKSICSFFLTFLLRMTLGQLKQLNQDK